MNRRGMAWTIGAALALTGCGANQPADEHQRPPVPNRSPVSLVHSRPEHTVVVIEENYARSEIIGNPEAPFINALAAHGADFDQAFGVEHPSQPNYLDLFSGSNQGVTSDSCPHTFDAPNLASELAAHHRTFVGYAESLPAAGSTVCANPAWDPVHPAYARKHAPWVDFSNVPATLNQPFLAFPRNYASLPDISFVVPNQQHDMHSGSVRAADQWLKQNLESYVTWAQTHNSLLVVTWDEDDKSRNNRIPMLFVGPMVKAGIYHEHIDHFRVLRTLEDLYRLPYLGRSAGEKPITDIWNHQVWTLS